jgi:hypothetical protein
MGAVIFAIIVGYYLMRALESATDQAKTEVRRYREEFSRSVKETREVIDRGARAGKSAWGHARTAWKAMKDAPRGACARAQKIAAGTGPLRRVARAARAGGKHGARSARQAWSSPRRPGGTAGAGTPGSQGAPRRPRVPAMGICGDCGLPAARTALSKGPNGRQVCQGCLADTPETPPAAPRPAPAPEAQTQDAVIVPDPALPPAPPRALPAAPQPTTAAAGPVPALPQPAARAAAPAGGTAPAITTGEPPMAPPADNLPVPSTHVFYPSGGAVSALSASGGESHNHGQWLAACDAQQRLAGQLIDQQHAMLANLHSVNGREQVTEITEWAGRARRYAVGVAQMVAVVNPGEQNLIGAINGAGGHQNIPDMPYFGE